ncbi:metabolite traffic protein EboE [Herpetosiphon sp. NSE202]|uniref:metabolite traffic protein EboE n=1 Tax=Herpetosiphon sp. NSE202 TaxID=3351349 RepID=UPI00362DA9E5
MEIKQTPQLDLTYCTNIHPANGWPAVLAGLQQHVLELKQRVAPDQAFGIGLRLSGQESHELLQPATLAAFQTWLTEHNLYVFTLNGFPYHPFHQQPVKDQVHAPDWQEPERVVYTLRLIEILAALLPNGMHGSISTSPLSYKPWFADLTSVPWNLLNRHVLQVVAALVQLERQRGILIQLAFEPEPDGLLETSSELISYFEQLLAVGSAELVAMLDCSLLEAQTAIRRHVGACLDTCHCAVAYEAPRTVIAKYQAAGLSIAKVQFSSALQVEFGDDRQAVATALAPFSEAIYLHQVIQRNRDGSLLQYRDLPQALAAIDDPQACEWRIHFHVPIFTSSFGVLNATQPALLESLQLLNEQPYSQHLEIETYTWDVLPSQLKLDLTESIAREYAWVLHELKR